MITALKKRTLNRALYTRDPKIEAKLVELELLSRDDLFARCSIARRSNLAYVPNECVLYFVRASRTENSSRDFERLCKILMERVLRILPKPDNADGSTLSFAKSQVREKAFDRFVEMLMEDRTGYSEKLDFFEVRFNGALASLRRDAQEQVWREENRTVELESDEESGEISAEVELAVGSYDPFDTREFDAADYRSCLDAAISTLPLLQRRIVEMIRQGILIDSKDAGVVTIAKTLNKSEKTIRTHRDKAYAVLRAALTEGESI